MISQYYEGVDNDKWIEIYNPGPEVVDLAAGGYRLGQWSDAAREAWKTNGAPTLAVALTGTIPADEIYLIQNPAAVEPVNAAAAHQTAAFDFDGDDSLVLYTGATYAFANVVDAFGLTGNTAADKSYIRNSPVITGANTDVGAEWYPTTLFMVSIALLGSSSYLGDHLSDVSTFHVVFDKPDGFQVIHEQMGYVTATAKHGSGMYSYAWDSTLGHDYYTTNMANRFSISHTAPIGSYSATVTVTDKGTMDFTEGTILFSVIPPPQYAITITPPTNGTVTTSPLTNAVAGAQVDVNATPSFGYAVDTITVVDADLAPVTVSGIRFIMPAKAVTVTVTFKPHIPSSLFISEVADPSNTVYEGRFVELYNAGPSNIDLAAGAWHLFRQSDGTPVSANIALTGTVIAGATYVVGGAGFASMYPGVPAQTNDAINGDGNDGYFLYSGGNHLYGILEDAYGVLDQNGTGKAWYYADRRAVRNNTVTGGNPTWTASEWTIPASANSADMTPGYHPESAIVITPPTNGTVTTTPAAVAAAGKTVTITATPDGGYRVAGIAVVDGALNPVTVNGNTFIMPASAVTVTVTFLPRADMATLPTSHTGPWQTNALPDGWTATGLGSPDAPDCTGGGGAAKFNGSGDELRIKYGSTAQRLSFWLRFSGSWDSRLSFKVQESVDGTNWTDLAVFGTALIPTNATPYTLVPTATSRFVRFRYVSEYFSGTVIAVDGVSLTDVVGYEVALDRPNGFLAPISNSTPITATATNGVAPYGYVWSSTLASAFYATNGNVFTILPTAPTGSYAATATATDSSGSPQSAANTVSFSVIVPPMSVTFDRTNGFNAVAGSVTVLKAAATNATPPYFYEWSSTLGSSYYSPVGSMFQILPTAPTGSYSATVVATDSSFTKHATNTVNFTVAVPPKYAITITPPTNGTVTTWPASNSAAGTSVTISATPDTGYKVNTIAVMDAASNPVSVVGAKFTMPAMAVTVTVGFRTASDTATLPTSFSGPGWYLGTWVPDGWTAKNVDDLSISYDASGTACSLWSGPDSSVRIKYGSVATQLTYWAKLEALGGWTTNIFTVQESTDGSVWTDLAVYDSLHPIPSTPTQYTNIPSAGSRYIRFIYTQKVNGSIGIDGVALLGGAAPTPLGVTVDKTNGFMVTQGSSAAITAMATNGAPPYAYAWSSTLGGSFYSTNGNVFTILTAVPTGSYSATVMVMDQAAGHASNTVTFTVQAALPSSKITSITLVAGVGFRFDVPAGYQLDRVEGADTVSGQSWNWKTLTLSPPGTDYTVNGNQITILTAPATKRMIRIQLLTTR